MRLSLLLFGIILVAVGVHLVTGNGWPLTNWTVWSWIKAVFGAVAVISGVERAFEALFSSDIDLRLGG